MDLYDCLKPYFLLGSVFQSRSVFDVEYFAFWEDIQRRFSMFQSYLELLYSIWSVFLAEILKFAWYKDLVVNS